MGRYSAQSKGVEYPVLKVNEKSGFSSSHAGHMELLTLCSIPLGSNQSIESTEV